MNTQNLQNLIKDKKLERISVSRQSVEKKYSKGFKQLQFAKRVKETFGNNEQYDSIIYTNVYEAVRLGCESLLLLRGYRVKSRNEYHYIVISAAELLLNEKFNNGFSRIKKMRKKRHDELYGTLTMSRIELNEAIKDVVGLFKKVKELILKNK